MSRVGCVDKVAGEVLDELEPGLGLGFPWGGAKFIGDALPAGDDVEVPFARLRFPPAPPLLAPPLPLFTHPLSSSDTFSNSRRILFLGDTCWVWYSTSRPAAVAEEGGET